MNYAIYTGDRLDVKGRPLKGKRALIKRDLCYQVRASFDDEETGYTHDWQLFPADDWVIQEVKIPLNEDYFISLIQVTIGNIQIAIDSYLGRLQEAIIQDTLLRERINELMRERNEQSERDNEE